MTVTGVVTYHSYMHPKLQHLEFCFQWPKLFEVNGWNFYTGSTYCQCGLLSLPLGTCEAWRTRLYLSLKVSLLLKFFSEKSNLEDILVPQEVRCWQSDSVTLKLLEKAASPRYGNWWYLHLTASGFQGGWLPVPSPALIFPALKICLPAFFDPCVIHADVCASSNVYVYS